MKGFVLGIFTTLLLEYLVAVALAARENSRYPVPKTFVEAFKS